MSISSSLSVRTRARLIVGIDYGTTYSGISLAMSTAADFKDVHAWTAYPGASSHNSEHCEKAPSWVAFASDNEELTENAWGYQVESGMKTYAWTKLLLDDSALPSEYDDPDLKKATGHGIMKLPRGRTAKDIATEYLRGMNKMYKGAIAEKFGERQLDSLPVDVWLTVPATWTEKAKLLTRQAALDAGFASGPNDRIMLIPEPEAAAHLALKSSFHHVQDLVEEGTGVMVCDLGGGTVDITCYEIERTSPTLQMQEICVGAGGKCGGTFVDRNLHKLMKKRFGSAFTSLSSRMTGPGSHFMDQFELKKRDFSMKHPSRRPHRLNLNMKDLQMTPELKKHYEESFGYVLITQDDMRSLFDPVVEKIVQLVSDQVDATMQDQGKKIDTMVLVGGFGSSPYIKECLQEWCSKRSIRLTTPWIGAWSAVVCGAVLRGVEGSLTTKKRCRRHYGYQLGAPYDSKKDKGYDKSKRRVWTDTFDNRTYLSGNMHWKIAKNAVLDENSNISDNFYKSISPRLGQKFASKLYACSLDVAPRTIESDRIEKVGEVEYTLDRLDFDELEDSIIDENGDIVYNVPLTLNIRMSDEVGLLVFRILCKGQECGKATLGFSFT